MRQHRELLVGVAAGILGAGAAALESTNATNVVTTAVIGFALGGARRHPRAATLVTVLALLAYATHRGSAPVGMAMLVAAHLFCIGRWQSLWTGLAGLVAIIAAVELAEALAHGNGFVPLLFFPIAAWGAGRALGEREVVAGQLAARARELEEEREAHAALSVRYERARIASELHDIVAHAISVMVIQAGAGQRLAARDPERTAETFEVIAGAARQAEADMGRLVALLSDETAIGPAPDLALVEELVGRAAGSGLDIRLRFEGEREGLPAPSAEAAYRVVQEGITNALRYAAGASVSVLLRGDDDALLVEVENGPASAQPDLAGAGTGNGIRGLRERVGGCGGTVDAGPRSDGGWRLSARLPRRVTAVAG